MDENISRLIEHLNTGGHDQDAAKQLVAAYASSTAEQRRVIAALLKPAGCGVLVGFARALGESSAESGELGIRMGLTAIAIEAGRHDFRDSLMALYSLYSGSERLGLETRQLFRDGYEQMSDVGWPRFSEDYRTFVDASPEAKYGKSWVEITDELQRKRSFGSRLRKLLGLEGE